MKGKNEGAGEPKEATGRALALMMALLFPPLGFALGTLTLIGPVRWATNAARSSGLSDRIESALVVTIIAALVAVTLLGALLLAYYGLRGQGWLRRVGVTAAVVCSAMLTLGAWMTPSLMARGSETTVVEGSRFTFGPYPSQEDLERLESEGYTHIVALLHPAVAPFEPKLLGDERRHIEKLDLELVHAPMLPWIGKNGESLKTIRRLAESGEGKYYVHCYLGRDRVGVVKRLVQSVTGEIPPDGENSGAQHPLFAKDHLERGPIYQLPNGVFVTPFPTPEEMVSIFQNVATDQVVSMLDPSDPSQLRRLETERAALSSVGIDLIEIPLTSDAELEALEAAANRIRSLEGVTLVHAFRSDGGVATRIVELMGNPTDPESP
jgi:protein tyrosine phosphatase (PTP) superfamily phosphohydrolase (DUF442 family)